MNKKAVIWGFLWGMIVGVNLTMVWVAPDSWRTGISLGLVEILILGLTIYQFFY